MQITTDNDYERSRKSDRKTCSDIKSCASRSSTLQEFADDANQSPSGKLPQLRLKSHCDRPVQRGAFVVDPKSNSLERKINDLSKHGKRSRDRDGCIQHRLGSDMRGCSNTGPVPSGRNEETYQREGTSRCILRCKSLHKRSHSESCAHQIRQHNVCGPNKPHGINNIRIIDADNSKAVEVLSGEKHAHYSRTPEGNFEYHCGRTIQSIQGLKQLEIG